MNREMRRKMKPDTRYVYGAVCTWSGSIQEVSKGDGSLPRCPQCGGPLFEMESKVIWDQQITDFENDGHPGYRDFQTWVGNLNPCMSVRDRDSILDAYVSSGGVEPPGLRRSED